MLPVLVLVCLAAGGTSGALSPLPKPSYDLFVMKFRETLLNQIALEVNNSVDMSKDLKLLMDNCKPKIQTKVDLCKKCTQSKCKSTVSFMDVLNLANPYVYLKKPLDKIGSKISDAIDLVGEHAGGFISSIKSLGESVKIPKEIKYVYSDVKEGLGSAIKTLEKVGIHIGKIAVDAGSVIGEGFKKLGDFFGKRRKREAIDPNVRKCMEKCSECTSLLLPTEKDIITAVCGPEIVKGNETMQALLEKIEDVYAQVLDTQNPIVLKVDVDSSSINYITQVVGKVKIHVFINGKADSYLTKVPVFMLDLVGAPAVGMAKEYWGKWGKK